METTQKAEVPSTATARVRPSGAAPSLLKIAGARASLEIRAFFRSKGQMVLTFSTPIVLLVLFSAIFGGKVEGTDLELSQLYATGMLAVGVMATSFQGLALQVSAERRNGSLKRLRGTPMPPVAYFLGKIAMVLVSSIGQAAVLLVIGSAFFKLKLPSGVGAWLTFGWLYVLGITACSLLGLAFSTLITGEEGGGPIVILPFMALQFISGVFVPFQSLPHYIQQIASFFPLKWLCQGMRSVFLPHSYLAQEPAHAWELDRAALVLGAWVVVGLVFCLTTFRWKGRNDG
ncbi:ABC transporter permease [Kitasatospora sp. NPDC088391]|uniref:ABC transporter permease n=1 Tax=Kitasatospora sp. NPDC088391 TaxID=3364074 RepID=UPI003825E139